MKKFSELSKGYKREHWEEGGQKTIAKFRLFPL